MKGLRETKKEQEKQIQSLKERLTNTENLLESKNARVKELEEETRKYAGLFDCSLKAN